MHSTIVSSAVGVIVVIMIHNGDGDPTSTRMTIRALMNIVWPCIVQMLLDREDWCNASIIPSIAWMSMVWWIDSYGLVRSSPSSSSRTRGMVLDSHTVTAMSFGLCGLVGARSDTRYVHFILYAILLCIMFVLPRHTLPDDDPVSLVVDEVQHMCLVWSIAMLITGVVLTRTGHQITKYPTTLQSS